MIQYPNGKKRLQQTLISKTNHARRGMELEKEINMTNQYYLAEDIAVIHKKPTPITIVKVDYPRRSAAKITEAYFKLPSTTDYNGIYKGKYIDFEAKECSLKTLFPLKLIHPHQITHLKKVMLQGGIAFLILRWTTYDETYLIKAFDVIDFYEHQARQSIPYQWCRSHAFLIPMSYVKPVDYLTIIDEQFIKGDS